MTLFEQNCVKNSFQFTVSVCCVCQECNILVFKFDYGKKVMEKEWRTKEWKKGNCERNVCMQDSGLLHC